jgi:hypothetical protein
MQNYINDYLENKSNYMNLRSQTGGQGLYKWINKLWGHTITISTGRKKVIDKPNEKETFDDGKRGIFSFVPEIFGDSYSVIMPIRYTEENLMIMKKFFKTKQWDDFITYCFSDIMSPNIPTAQFHPEIYKLDNIQTYLKNLRDIIASVIEFTIKKYDYVDAYEEFKKSKSMNKKWRDDTQKFPLITVSDFYQSVTEGFFKSTEEGEFHIPGIGQLNLGIHTRMRFDYIDKD